MKRVPLTVPETVMPKKDPVNPCPCQDRPVHLTYKTCTLLWLVPLGAKVCKGDVVAEGEVEKKAIEFRSDADGILAERLLEDDDEFTVGDVLGYIETEDES